MLAGSRALLLALSLASPLALLLALPLALPPASLLALLPALVAWLRGGVFFGVFEEREAVFTAGNKKLLSSSRLARFWGVAGGS